MIDRRDIVIWQSDSKVFKSKTPLSFWSVDIWSGWKNQEKEPTSSTHPPTPSWNSRYHRPTLGALPTGCHWKLKMKKSSRHEAGSHSWLTSIRRMIADGAGSETIDACRSTDQIWRHTFAFNLQNTHCANRQIHPTPDHFPRPNAVDLSNAHAIVKQVSSHAAKRLETRFRVESPKHPLREPATHPTHKFTHFPRARCLCSCDRETSPPATQLCCSDRLTPG